MREQIRGHKGAVAMTANSHAFGIGNSHFGRLLDRRLCAGNDLLDVSIVHRLRITDYRHRSVIKNGVSLRDQEQL